jgi:hypothetical protein
MVSPVIGTPDAISRPCIIQLGSMTENLPWTDYAAILERVLPAKVVFAAGVIPGSAGELVFEGPSEPARPSSLRTISTLRLPRGQQGGSDGRLRDVTVRFADSPDVPFPFRGRTLQAKVAEDPSPLVLTGTERALATCEGRPVWAISVDEGVRQFKSGFALPNLASGQGLIDLFAAERLVEILPLLHWVREIGGSTRWEGPPLRAGFIFDDPNLHWPRYGFVDFQEIAKRAASKNYHVSFATIPLDAWYTHRGTAALFRSQAKRLSLCVHGNNHAKAELARNFSEHERRWLLTQAIQRIEKLERRAGLRVCRVMVPPHGACSEAILADLPRCGFESACISHGSLRAHNKSKPWTTTLGALPAELIAGCPVLPRWPMAGRTTNTILWAAYLKQPIVLRGHHQDLKDGVELLDNLAGAINDLGSVYWGTMTDLSRTNYQWHMAGTLCRLRPMSSKVTFPLPDNTRSLIIENVGLSDWESWQISSANGSMLKVRAGEPVAVAAAQTGIVAMEAASAKPISDSQVSYLPSATAVLRRLFTESRDRLRLN